MEMVQCQEAPLHGKKIYGNLPAARHAPSKKVRYTSYYRFLRCAFLWVKKNYGKIRPDARQIFTDPCRTFLSCPNSVGDCRADMSGHCLCGLSRLSCCCAVWVCASWWRLGMRVECCVCEVFFWCCDGIWMVLLVYGWSLAGGCLGGGGMACCELSQYGSIFQWCVAFVRTDTTHINTKYQAILHTFGPWHLQRFSCPDWRSLDTEKAACVACDKVNKCKIWSKQMKDSQNNFAFSRESVIFPARFFFWLNGWRFYANSSASSGSRQAKVQVTLL